MRGIRVYVAAPLPLLGLAKTTADWLRGEGFHVASSWHVGAPTVADERELDVETLEAVARQCAGELLRTDVLVLLVGPETTRHGSILEAGVALGRGASVVEIATGPDAVFPTILLGAFLRCARPVSTLGALGPKGVARWVQSAFDLQILPVVPWVGRDPGASSEQPGRTGLEPVQIRPLVPETSAADGRGGAR